MYIIPNQADIKVPMESLAMGDEYSTPSTMRAQGQIEVSAAARLFKRSVGVTLAGVALNVLGRSGNKNVARLGIAIGAIGLTGDALSMHGAWHGQEVIAAAGHIEEAEEHGTLVIKGPNPSEELVLSTLLSKYASNN